MKTIFLLLLLVVLAFFPIGLQKLSGKKDELSRRMIAVLIPACISVIAHIAVIFSHNIIFSLVFYSIYFASATWISTFVFSFCVSYVGNKIHKYIFNFVVFPLSVIDTLVVFSNIFKPFLFTLALSVYRGEDYIRYIPNSLFLIHVIFGYGLFVYCFGLFFVQMWSNPPTLRVKYYSFLTFLFFIIVSNIAYILVDIPFNFSILIYAFCFVGAYHVLFHLIPERLIQKTLGLIADGLKNGIVLLDNSNRCIYVNSFVHNILDCDEYSFLNQDFVVEFLRKKEEANAEEYAPFSSEFKISKNDIQMVFQISDFFIKESDVLLGKYYLIEDITRTQSLVQEGKMLQTRDKLTGLYNQEYFFEKAEYRLKFDRFTQYCLIVTDLVNFKLINDLHGKSFGDTILLRLADSIKTNAAPDDIYGRLYNDHFVLLVPKRHFNETAFIEAFKNKMAYLASFSYNLVGHMGVYEIDDLSIPISVMCDRAFLALRSIKSDYKITVAYYDDKLRQELLKMQLLMNELPQALKSGQLHVYLQPQLTKNGELVGAEALVRWHHPIRGVISPKEFIEVIEKINIISEVDRYVWECVCQKLSEWKQKGINNIGISVNISAKDFFTMDLYKTFTELVEKYDIQPDMLNLEINESAVILDLENQTKILDKLRSAGFVVEMDDFGKGYSGLNILKDIPADVLKIDMSFFQNTKNSERNNVIFENIVELANRLGIKVIAEGVENSDQIEYLSKVGCNIFQGFYFSRPIPIEDFETNFF